MWRRLLCQGMLGLLVAMCASAQVAPNNQENLVVTGQLRRVAGIGGESTGWAMRLDSEIAVQGKAMKSIEVSGQPKEFERLENKRVEAKGKIAFRHGVERGDWPILEVTAIKEIESK